mgnify:FL=1
MAEGFSKIKLYNKYKIYSAGVEAHGLNPKAVSVMREIGIDISNQQSKSISNDELFQYDIIVTLCGDARDRCPTLIGEQHNIHWGLKDPAKATGTNKEIMDTYRNVRDQISSNIDSLL